MFRNPCGHRSLKLILKSNRRGLSNAAQRFPPKVRAFPFAFSTEEAILRLGVPMSIKCWGRDFFRSVAARLLPGMGFQPLRPNRIQAIYLPIWLVDAEVEAQIWVQDHSDKSETIERIARVFFQQSYVPGFVYEPLSRISLNSMLFDRGSTIRFSEDLLTQRGTEILCLPFSVTPFPLLDVARSLSYQQATISEQLKFDPSAVKANLFAAYPVLVPIYLAQYEMPAIDTGDPLTFTAILEAFTRKGRIVTEDRDREQAQRILNKDPNGPDFFKRFIDYLSPREFWVNDGSNSISRFAPLELHATMPHVKLSQGALEKWVNDAAATKGAIESYQAKYFPCSATESGVNVVDWDDLRIREFTDEEKMANRVWMDLGRMWMVNKNVEEVHRFYPRRVQRSPWRS
ncbi:uncharacterized protein LAESUDRAFT_731876 [Laetiporus sulphureus 93-53]|uniref:Uncharacterized protein n=1 Tax=Laetiporus sulphureus 93-53 TaxID=1314785 RepID=A0A165BDK9_9APHY|nr:uncharacterized protein LAESUDRAFT_731876 [Laetiporus sulphureus 93-53]KZT00810.1 hypothetical protein LAESUDRAFT_731876 [Laetiporus sulphureus 93-53]